MIKRNINVYAFILTLVTVCVATGIVSPRVLASVAGPPAQFLNMTGFTALDSDASQWNIFHDQGYTKGQVQSFNKSGDGSLQVNLMHGKQSYADILAYRDLPAMDNATQFSMDVSFRYHNEKPVQALEFTMDKWVNGVRWEWALQWQIVPDGSSLAATPKTWRVWNGSAWQSLQVPQDLPINQWHTLHLYGNIVNNQVHYIGFTCDKVYTDMSQLTFDPAASAGDKVGVGVQLDGNYKEAAYPVYYRDINLNYQ